MNTGLSAMPSPSHYSITFFRQPSRNSLLVLAWSTSTEQPSATVASSRFLPTLAGIRRFFSPYDPLSSAQSLPSSARCRSAEKKTHLARRRGGGMTARATPRPPSGVRHYLMTGPATFCSHTKFTTGLDDARA